jgi:hypothetical protein
LFKEHLKKALIESKLEFETNKVLGNGKDQTKPKSNKPIKMSLDQFQKSYEVNGKTTIQTNQSSESRLLNLDLVALLIHIQINTFRLIKGSNLFLIF